MSFKENSLYCGDCLEVLRAWPDCCVDLVYLDPPWNSDVDYNILFKDGKKTSTLAQNIAFQDTWFWDEAAKERVESIKRAKKHPSHDAIVAFQRLLGECGMLAYLSYMSERLVEIWRVLKDYGSLYFHCDATASHYLKLMMDSILSTKNFRREIVWANEDSSGYKAGAHNWIRGHDTILYYIKRDGRGGVKQSTFNKQFIPYREEYIKQHMKLIDHDGRRYRQRGSKRYYADDRGTPMSSVWTGISSFQTITASSEYLGYPTQKRLPLLERIIKASSNPGDVVLDPFCGCGTTMEAAMKLDRHFVGIDISHFAIDIVRDLRLKDATIPVNGFPADMESARKLAQESPFEFEKWVVTRVPGMIPNNVQVGDGGVDGRGIVYSTGGSVLCQVKGGHKTSLSHLRDFLHVLRKNEAECGFFTTLEPWQSQNARLETASLGHFSIGITEYPRAQLWSVGEYFDAKLPDLPPLADPLTGKHELRGSIFGDRYI